MAMRTLCSIAVAAALAGCTDDADPGPRCEAAALGTSFVAVRPPAEAVAVPGDDHTLVVWHERDEAAQRGTLHARCLGADGNAIAPDAVLARDHYVDSAFRAARRPDGRYVVVFGEWSGVFEDPRTLYLAEVDCAAGWGASRRVLGPAPELYVMDVVATDELVAFTHTATDAIGLVIDRDGETTPVTVDTIYAGAALATSGDALAVAWSAADGPRLAIYDTGGGLVAGPSALPGRVSDLCWDGAEWAATGGDDQVMVWWFRPSGALGQSVLISDDDHSSGQSLACDRGRVFAVWQRNTGGVVPGMDLFEAVIALGQVDPDATVASVVDVEPPAGRISMVPVVSLGERVVVSWSSFGDTWYEQRIAASPPCD